MSSLTSTAEQFADTIRVPRERRDALLEVIALIEGASDIALTTHVNADGDGAGSQTALSAWLATRGKRVAITNPTAYPDRFRFLAPDGVDIVDPGPDQDARVRAADLLLVLDTGEPGRIGRVAKGLEGRRVAILDHHPTSPESIPGPGVRDPSACATGEIIYDLLSLAAPGPWSQNVIEGIYTAIEMDTGSFRFSNTTPRTHAIASDLLSRGLDPERMYRQLHGMVPRKRLDILRLALDNLEQDPDLPITWITIPRVVTHDMAASADDLDGVAEYARSIEGTEVALLFRETVEGGTKVSFRSNGAVDVNAVAREFGGGGHVKAAGALIGGPVASTRPRVLEATRNAVRRTLDPNTTP